MAAKPSPQKLLRLEYLDVDTLVEWKGNAKRHDLNFMAQAFEENGFVEPIVVDDGSGKMVAGHGRRKQLLKMKAAGEPPPPGIDQRGGKWFVPVVCGRELPKPGKHVLASNRGVELGGWDPKLLLASVKALADDLRGTGYVREDLTRLAALSKTGWDSDIDVGKSGSHMDAIPGKIVITCAAKQTATVREVVTAAVKRKGIKGVDVR